MLLTLPMTISITPVLVMLTVVFSTTAMALLLLLLTINRLSMSLIPSLESIILTGHNTLSVIPSSSILTHILAMHRIDLDLLMLFRSRSQTGHRRFLRGIGIQRIRRLNRMIRRGFRRWWWWMRHADSPLQPFELQNLSLLAVSSLFVLDLDPQIRVIFHSSAVSPSFPASPSPFPRSLAKELATMIPSLDSPSVRTPPLNFETAPYLSGSHSNTAMRRRLSVLPSGFSVHVGWAFVLYLCLVPYPLQHSFKYNYRSSFDLQLTRYPYVPT